MRIQIEIVRTRSTIYLYCNENDTINRIMELINVKLDIPIEWQQLQLNNGQLIDHNQNRDTLLSHYNIQNGTVIKLNVNVPSNPNRYNNNNSSSSNDIGIGNNSRQSQQRPNGSGTSSSTLRIIRPTTTSSSSIQYRKKQIRLHRKKFRARTTFKRRVVL